MAKSEIKMKMSLDSSGVKRGLSRARASIGNFAQAAKDKLGSVANLVAGGLVAGFAAAARSALAYGKEMRNLAAISDTGFEEFQKVAAAAKTVGIEQDKLADIYKDFNERVGQFLRGDGGELAPFFEGVGKAAGVTAEQMASLSGNQGMRLYVKTLQDAGVGTRELSSYMEDVASDATALIPLYKDNAKLLDALGDASEKNGEIMSKATGDALAKAQIAIDKFKTKATIEVGQIISGADSHAAIKEFGTLFLIEVSNIKEGLLNAILDAVVAFPRGILAGLNKARASLVGDSRPFGEFFDEAKKEIPDLPFKFDDSGTRAILQETANIYKDMQVSSANRNKTERNTVEVTRQLTEEQEMHQELAEAAAIGDRNLIQLANEKIDRQSRINALAKKGNMHPKRAAVLIDQQIAKEKERKLLQADLMEAQLSGNIKAISAAEHKIAVDKKALEIAKKTGKAYHDAEILAERILKMEAGADVDRSGFITRREQKEFDRQQKIIAKQNKKDQHAEKMKEMREGGGIRNVSGDWKEARKQRLAERDAKRRQKEQEKAIKQRDIEEKKDPAKKRAREIGELAAKVMKDAKNAVKKAAEDQKKIDQNPVVKGLKPLLKSQVDLLGDIKKALQC